MTDVGIDSVYFDGYANAQKAVQHLIDCGCKKICHITGATEAADCAGTYERFRRLYGKKIICIMIEKPCWFMAIIAIRADIHA